jgi:hypothetical protein
MQGLTVKSDVFTNYAVVHCICRFIIIIIITAIEILPCGSGTTIRRNTQMHISHKIIHHAQKNTAHKAT